MGNIYTLVGEEEGSPFRDAKEFSTLLNACGRLGKASLGIGACLGDKKIKKKTIAILTEYKKELLNALNWFNSDKSSKDIVKGDGFIIINAKDNIRETIIGTFASIISKSKRVGKNIYVVAMAQSDKDIKISLRISGSHFRNEIDLNKMIINIVNETGGIAGGHQYASGALIPSDKEEQFIQLARQILYKKSMEEKIV